MSQDKKNINELLAALQEASKQVSYDIWVPSLHKSVKFSDITTGQQKELIRALVDNPVYRTNFILAFFQILKDNCLDKDVNVGSLSIYDKFAIAVQLRNAVVSGQVKIETDDGVTKVSIVDNYETRFDLTTELIAKEIKSDAITILVTVPTIAREAQLERELRANLAKTNVESFDDVRNMLADAYIGELAKYITKVSINGTDINVGSLDFKQAYKVVETLPANLIKQAVEFLEHVQTVLGNWATFPVVDDSGANTDQKAEITVDAAFFAGK